MSKKCTWKDCPLEARHPRRNSFGETWSNVCDKHDEKMKAAAIKAFESGGKDGAAKLASMWVKAQGGSEAVTRRVTGK